MPPKKKRTLPILFVLLLLLAAAGAWFVLSSGAALDQEKLAGANMVATAERRDIESRLLLSGEVIPAFQVEVKPEVGGKVKEIAVQIGQSVKKGDLLAVIDDTDLLTEKRSAQTAIEGAQLTVDRDRGNYERAKALFDEKLISKEVYANLEADLRISENALERSESQLQSVEDRLSKTRILAPADGTVLDIAVNEGQVVTAAASVNSGTTLMTFADLSRLLIDTHVNQMDVAKVKSGQTVSVNMQGDFAEPVEARVEFVAPLATVKNNIKGFQVEALIEENSDRLKPGMSVSMTVPVGAATDAVSVPLSAVFNDQDERIVFVRKGETSERRPVEVGVTNMSYAEILSGLSEGEQVLLTDPRGMLNRS